GQLVRPLLASGRSEIEHYAQHHGLAFVDDVSNRDTAMDRNFLRAQVLPLLATRWPAYRRSVARAAGHLSAAALALGDNHGAADPVVSIMGDPGIALSSLLREPAEAAAARLRAWLRERGCLAPDRAALDEFLRQL